jgi:hypothetical protein
MDEQRAATKKLDRDSDNFHDLQETVVHGGDYLRLTLIGTPPEAHSRIGTAFDALFELADHDPDRPLIRVLPRRKGRLTVSSR